jgi:RAVE protein 1 C terminal
MYLFSEPPRNDKDKGKKSAESLMEYVARQNGPLDDYHPQMLLQCLLWGTLSKQNKKTLFFYFKNAYRESGTRQRDYCEPRTIHGREDGRHQ